MLGNRLRVALLVLLAAFVTAAPHAEAASKYSILHSFAGKPDGGGVFAGLTLGPNGNLWGDDWGRHLRLRYGV